MKTSPLKKIEHGIKWLILGIWRVFLKKGRSGFSVINPDNINKVLFLRPDKLGDMVISLPVFYNLKKLYPHLQLYTICSPKNLSMIYGNTSIDENYIYTKNIWHDIGMVRKIRRMGIDVIIDMVRNDSATSLILSQYCSRKGVRAGSGKSKHRPFYDYNYEFDETNEDHTLENTLKLLTAFGIETEYLEKHIPPAIKDAQYAKASDFFDSVKENNKSKVIGLNISAGKPSRKWSDDKNRKLIDQIIDKYPNVKIIVMSDPSERKRGENLINGFGSAVSLIPKGLSLPALSSLISMLSLLVTPDTSLVHIARSFNIPVVGLYTGYKKNLNLWRPFNQNNGIVTSNNDYNIFDIEVNTVFSEMSKVLEPEG